MPVFARSLTGLAILLVAAGVLASGNAETTLSGRAHAALVEAERAVSRAQAERALWTTAEEALRNARHALEQGNLASAIKQARVAKEHAHLGIAQKNYPLTR
jgi:hypothetical protein